MLVVEIALLYLFIVYSKSRAALRLVQSFTPGENSTPLEEIVIVQPILSGDPKLKKTIEANLLTLQGVSFYWLVDDDDSDAHAIVDALIEQHRDSQITKQSFPPAPDGINPKIFKINKALFHSNLPYCIVLDDDTILPYKSLLALIAELEQCTLSTGLPQYKPGKNFASSLLAAFVNNNSSMTYLSTQLFMDAITINGMCYALKREDFIRLGGFKLILHHLTDDLAVAGMILDNGGTIHQIPERQIIETHMVNNMAYFRQMHRWYVFANILLKQQSSRNRFFITSMYGLPPLLLILLFCCCFLSPTLPNWVILLVTLTVRHLIIMQHNPQYHPVNVPFILLSILSEILQSFHFLHALATQRIHWRKRVYKVYSNDRFTNI